MALAKTNGGFFSFIPNSKVRKIAEVLTASIPGGVIFFIFIVGTGILNIFSSSAGPNNIFAVTYIPVICILPIVLGVIGPLILEKIRAGHTLSLRGSVAVSFMSALTGSFFGTLTLVLTGLVGAGFRPFGGVFEPFLGAPGLLAALLLIVAISTTLSTIGGAIIVVLLNRAGN